MTSRARYEAQIQHYQTFGGNELDSAIRCLVRRYGGLSFFTDDQVEEIRAVMVEDEWDRRCRNREMQARNRAVLESRRQIKESSHV